MRHSFRVWVIVVSLALAMLMSGGGHAEPGASSPETPGQATPPGPIGRTGFFYRGGKDVPRPATGIFGDTSDYIRAYQIAVLYLLPASNNAKLPIVILPGFGIAVETFLQTPDGNPGWAMNFVEAGYPVYLVEPSHTVRSGIDTGFYLKQDNSGKSGELFTWGGRHVWRRWGLGPEYGVAAENGRFPVEHYDQVVSGFTAIETDRIDGFRNIEYQLPSNVTALISLLEEIGPAIVLAHSASGVPAFETAIRRPDLVKAIVAVEPVGCPGQESSKLKQVAVLSLFGDHMEWRPQMPARREQCQLTVESVQGMGLPAAMLDLPAMGIQGNSHLMYLEDNSRDLAGHILEWLGNVDKP